MAQGFTNIFKKEYIVINLRDLEKYEVNGVVDIPALVAAKRIKKAKEGKSYVLTTGTGSGKSLAYIVPIVDHVLRNGSGRGIQAIVVYPMNALANSQGEELKKFLEKGYPEGQPPVRGEAAGTDRGDVQDLSATGG